jgi:predicted AAA+ superfamily ATPase
MLAQNLKARVLGNFLPPSDKKGLIVLTGARQTGKTTLAKLKYEGVRYINLDAPENREMLRKIATALWASSIGEAVIDEAQKEPVVFEKIKYAYDDGSVKFSLLLGSSQILLLKKIRESLAGRVSIYEIWPLLMSEIYCDKDYIKTPLVDRLFTQEDLSSIFRSAPSVLMVEEDSLLQKAEDYILQWGGMPALLSLSDSERWKWLKDYEYTYLERDLSDLARLEDLEPFTKFKRLSALRSGKLLNYSELARDASISVDTARRYLEYLRLSYQTILLQPYHKNLTSSVIKTPKIYWLDIGLLRQLSGQKGELTEEIYETMVVNELFKWVKTTQKDADIYFYRTHSGLELDILLETEFGVIGMEIKARNRLASTDIRAMRDVAMSLGSQWRGGIVIYQGDEIKQIAEPGIWAVPSRRLFI